MDAHPRRADTRQAPLIEFASPIPYAALHQLVDEPNRWDQCAYEKGIQLAELTVFRSSVNIPPAGS